MSYIAFYIVLFYYIPVEFCSSDIDSSDVALTKLTLEFFFNYFLYSFSFLLHLSPSSITIIIVTTLTLQYSFLRN